MRSASHSPSLLLTFSNITIADSTCASYCVYFIISSPALDIPFNNFTFTNVQSVGVSDNYLFYLFNSIPNTAFSVNNLAATNVTGFTDFFYYSNVNLTMSGSFDYNNVTTNATVTPLFNCGFHNDTYLTVNTFLNLPLSELFPPFSKCTADYLGFPIDMNTNSGPFNAPSNFPTAWIIACACFSLVAIVLVVCFILYRRTTPSYTSIDG